MIDREIGRKRANTKIENLRDQGQEIKSNISLKIEKRMMTGISTEKKRIPLKNGRDKEMRTFVKNIENSDLTLLQKVMKANNQRSHRK